MDVIGKMLAAQQGPGSDQGLLTQPEAERMIEGLQTFELRDIGTPKWFTQHDWISRLNLQAHHNAATHSEEFVVELLVSLDKMGTLVQNLLAIEAWKQVVLPHLKKHLANKVEPTMSYIVLYHECAVANLLEVTLYHSSALESLSEEHLLELSDWCYRKLVYLNSPEGRSAANPGEVSAQELMSQSKEQELDDRLAETQFGAAMLGVTILRYLTDGVTTLPMGLLSRLVSTNDTLMALVPLLDSPPWVRRRGSGKAVRLEKWIHNAWEQVAPADRLKLTQADGQVWLAVNNLVVEPRCRAKYGADEWRRDRLLSLKRHMNELLFDQLPVLKDLQRVLDEMALGVGAPDAASARSAALILEAVPGLREGLLREAGDPRVLALDQARGVFSEEEARRLARAQMEAMLKQLEFIADMQGGGAQGGPGGADGAGPQSAGSAAQAAGVGPIRVSCWRKAHESGVHESWCEFELSVDAARPPEPVSLEDLTALRYRLLPLDPDSTRPLPSDGKVCVKLTAPGPGTEAAPGVPLLMAEALLQLPEVPVRSAAGEKPPVVWVNIGLLAEDGLVLQLKLKRAEKPRERDKVAGVWYAYHPVGGALTVLRGVLDVKLAAGGEGRGQPGARASGLGSGEAVTPAIGLQGISAGVGSAPAHSKGIQVVGSGPASRAVGAQQQQQQQAPKSGATPAPQAVQMPASSQQQGSGISPVDSGAGSGATSPSSSSSSSHAMTASIASTDAAPAHVSQKQSALFSQDEHAAAPEPYVDLDLPD